MPIAIVTCPHCKGAGYRWMCRVNPFAVKRPWEHSEKRTCFLCCGDGEVVSSVAATYQQAVA